VRKALDKASKEEEAQSIQAEAEHKDKVVVAVEHKVVAVVAGKVVVGGHEAVDVEHKSAAVVGIDTAVVVDFVVAP